MVLPVLDLLGVQHDPQSDPLRFGVGVVVHRERMTSTAKCATLSIAAGTGTATDPRVPRNSRSPMLPRLQCTPQPSPQAARRAPPIELGVGAFHGLDII